MSKIGAIKSFTGLRRNIKCTTEEMQQLQEKKLRKILRYAYDNSNFYREKFNAAGIDKSNIDILPITDFPTTYKQEIMENYTDVITVKDKFTQRELLEYDKSKKKGLFRGKYHVVHSSGSTGVPRFFVYSSKEWAFIMSATVRACFWGMSVKDIKGFIGNGTKVLYIAAINGAFGGVSLVKSLSKRLGMDIRFLDINQPMVEWKKLAEEFTPTIIVGYPTSIKIFAQIVNENRLQVKTRRIISTGEPLTVQLHSFLDSIFGCTIVDFYTCSESLTIGVTVDSDDGIIFDDVNLIEYIDGEMYLTSLYNYTQPLIRYRVTDRIKLFSAFNYSMNPFNRYKVLHGREDDIFWMRDDEGNVEFLHPLTMEDFCEEGLIDYQIVQKDRKSFNILAEMEKDADEEEIIKSLEEGISEVLNEHKLHFVDFEVERVDEILANPKTGKKRLAIPLKRKE